MQPVYDLYKRAVTHWELRPQIGGNSHQQTPERSAVVNSSSTERLSFPQPQVMPIYLSVSLRDRLALSTHKYLPFT